MKVYTTIKKGPNKGKKQFLGWEASYNSLQHKYEILKKKKWDADVKNGMLKDQIRTSHELNSRALERLAYLLNTTDDDKTIDVLAEVIGLLSLDDQ
jgi:hypothetical protein